jgi:hypothetical protein
MSSTSQVPLLSEKHSGIPQNLLEKAQKAKALIYDTRTKDTGTRQRLPVIPQGIEKENFDRALEELAQQLGNENLEVNDKPLVDGWYMERKSCNDYFPNGGTDDFKDPNTHDMMPTLDDEELIASAVVYPSSTEEVQKIVL